MQVSDEFLIQKIQEGDKDSFEQLFRNYYGQLCSYAQGYVKNPQVAEDQVQEVFVNIWEQKEDWNPQGTIKSYLYKAVRNQSLNYLKHVKVVEEWKQKKASTRNPSPFPPTEKRVDYDQIKRWVQEAVLLLPEKRRTIYKLSRDHGLTYLEISKALNISVKTVETQMGRSLEHLRSWLKDKIE
jgi:RNA polymerase sigma-70 factor (ECF subfamily)